MSAAHSVTKYIIEQAKYIICKLAECLFKARVLDFHHINECSLHLKHCPLSSYSADWVCQ